MLFCVSWFDWFKWFIVSSNFNCSLTCKSYFSAYFVQKSQGTSVILSQCSEWGATQCFTAISRGHYDSHRPTRGRQGCIKAQFIPNQKMPNFPLSFSVIYYCWSLFLFDFSALSNYADVCFLFKEMEKDVCACAARIIKCIRKSACCWLSVHE